MFNVMYLYDNIQCYVFIWKMFNVMYLFGKCSMLCTYLENVQCYVFIWKRSSMIWIVIEIIL